MKNKNNSDKAISHAVARLQARILAFVFAMLGGLGLFLMTAWLLIKGGENVGEHLQLLGHYFIGYTVTWRGSLVGFFYGALVGGLIGWMIGRIYNLAVGIRYK
jgi:hypothetical protein